MKLTDKEHLQIIADEFRRRLTREEAEFLGPLKKDVSTSIIWKQLVELTLKILMPMLRTAVFRDGKSQWMRPLNQPMTPSEKKYFTGIRGELRQEYILLLLIRKLLGATKTVINKRIGEVEALSQQEEKVVGDRIAELTQREPDTMGETDLLEEIEKLLETGTYNPETLPPPKTSTGCTHVGGKSFKYKEVSGGTMITTTCLRCLENLGTRLEVRKTWDGYRTPTKKECEHDIRWVKGQEGKKAYCVLCPIEINDPEIYDWVDVGLEPFGDDPSKDELIVLEVVRS